MKLYLFVISVFIIGCSDDTIQIKTTPVNNISCNAYVEIQQHTYNGTELIGAYYVNRDTVIDFKTLNDYTLGYTVSGYTGCITNFSINNIDNWNITTDKSFDENVLLEINHKYSIRINY